MSGQQTMTYAAARDAWARIKDFLIALVAAPFILLLAFIMFMMVQDWVQVGGMSGDFGGFILVLLFFLLFCHVFYQAVSLALKKMEYGLGDSCLLLSYGNSCNEIRYDGIREIGTLRHYEFFDGNIRMAGYKSFLSGVYGLDTESTLFCRYDHLRFGPVFLCVTMAQEYVIIFFHEPGVPALLLSPERISDFLDDLKSRCKITPSPV